MVRDFFIGFVKVHLLHHAANGPIYGLEMIEELGRHGYHLSPGTLYPALRSLAAAGLLVSEGRVVGGRVRKYYAITEKGKGALSEAKEKIRELVREVLA
ncbi:MAG: helix-turn-helix transcriptional regulator, partial [Armatimonadetes bacterium]|nr:helix-turn-helix transcriptional regulator [Armatimonadota bacterium]